LQRTREKLYKKYQGTRLGKQELGGQILEDVPGAVATVDQLAVARRSEHPSLSKRIVMIDPSQTNTETSDDTGITVQGRAGDEVYLLADLTMKGDVSEWVDVAVEGAVRWECPEIHYEAPGGSNTDRDVIKAGIDRYNERLRMAWEDEFVVRVRELPKNPQLMTLDNDYQRTLKIESKWFLPLSEALSSSDAHH
jgi:phage terminase large subunit-like protein